MVIDFKTQRSDRDLVAYLYKGQVFMRSYFRNSIGILEEAGWIRMAGEGDFTALGQHILDLLAQPEVIIPPEVPGEDPNDDPLLKLMKLRTWSAIMRKTHSIMVEQYGKDLVFVPMKFLGLRGDRKGYDWIYDKAIITDDLSPENLGKLLMEAMALSENYLLDDA